MAFLVFVSLALVVRTVSCFSEELPYKPIVEEGKLPEVSKMFTVPRSDYPPLMKLAGEAINETKDPEARKLLESMKKEPESIDGFHTKEGKEGYNVWLSNDKNLTRSCSIAFYVTGKTVVEQKLSKVVHYMCTNAFRVRTTVPPVTEAAVRS